MKKRLQVLLAGVLVGTIVAGGVSFAKQASESINVIYDNIKIMIDGKEYQPTDANGNAVEPFIYNGTTYLPVRAIANAFDKDVDWEAQTSTVTLGSKNYDWLDQMGFVDYETTGSDFGAISAGTEMSDGIKYDRGLWFYIRDYVNGGDAVRNNDDSVECYQEVSFLLNNQYKAFEGTIAEYSSNEGKAQIKFYGDGNLLYSSPIISDGMKSTKFSVDVSGIKLLKIRVEYVNSDNNGYYASVRPCIADARLSKK